MGYVVHHAIVVTGILYGGHMERAHEEASRVFSWVSPICPETVNGTVAFFIPPDGSKEGWDASNDGDDRRAAFIEWMDTQRFSDGSCPLDWVEIEYGGDSHDALVIAHGDEAARKRPGKLQ